MKILILERDYNEACRLKHELLAVGNGYKNIEIFDSIEKWNYQDSHFDLLLLGLEAYHDLDLVKDIVHSCQTIVYGEGTELMIKALEMGALDYMEMPADRKKLEIGLSRYHGVKAKKEKINFLPVADNGIVKLLPINEILYIEADMKNSLIFLTDGSSVLCKRSLKQLGKILANDFVRVHKSYLARKNSLGEMKKKSGHLYEVSVSGKVNIPVARRYARMEKAG